MKQVIFGRTHVFCTVAAKTQLPAASETATAATPVTATKETRRVVRSCYAASYYYASNTAAVVVIVHLASVWGGNFLGYLNDLKLRRKAFLI